MSNIEVKKITPEDEEILEEWDRVTTRDSELLGVEAVRVGHGDWPWAVYVSVMEFIRTEPLESELATAISTALAAISGVTSVAHEDREKWIIKGQTDGPSLVRAAAEVLDRFLQRTRKAIEELDAGRSPAGYDVEETRCAAAMRT